MQKIGFLFLFVVTSFFGQQSDFKHINFAKADYIAKKTKSKRLYDLNKLTFELTQNLETDVEKVRAIYIWICNNIANDFRLYTLNERKRNKYVKDSIELQNWNSKFKNVLFKKLLRKKRTICTGYAYLFKEMCALADIKALMINGFGRTATVDFEKLVMPNHTWNAVQLNNKWYLCDPTWSTGISFPEEGRFQFNYNDGYFLTKPKLFFLNHFPLEQQHSLLGDETSSFKAFTEMPLVYANAFQYLSEHVAPSTMYHEITQDSIVTFQYQLKKNINLQNVKLVLNTGTNDKTVKPKTTINNNLLTLEYAFPKKGFYDVHLYFDDKIIATYVFQVAESKS